MSRKQHVVDLTESGRATCATIVRRGTAAAFVQRRARILLQADVARPGRRLTDAAVAAAVLVGPRTVARVRHQFATEGLDAALGRRPRRANTPRKLDSAAKARLVATACGDPPAGHATWTLRLLANRAVALHIVDAISHETVRSTLKKTSSNPG